MTTAPQRIAIAVACTALMLAGCADKPQRATTPTTTTTTSSTTSTKSAASHSTSGSTHAKTAAPKPEKLPDSTGVPACDSYLSTYVACHQVAGIYAPDQIEAHYQMMRTSLLRDSLDPDIRPQLGSRCISLSNHLRDALHGKSCNAPPASSTSSARP